MIVPVEVKRDARGYWKHPALLRGDGQNPAALRFWLQTNGLQCFVMTMSDEVPDIFGCMPDARCWHPEPPPGNGWFIGSIHGTDDGPVCYWFRTNPTI